jgi:hypothetical protein
MEEAKAEAYANDPQTELVMFQILNTIFSSDARTRVYLYVGDVSR